MAWTPLKRIPYYPEQERAAYQTGYARGYHREPKPHPLDARWPCAYSRGYWDGFADNPRGEAHA